MNCQVWVCGRRGLKTFHGTVSQKSLRPETFHGTVFRKSRMLRLLVCACGRRELWTFRGPGRQSSVCGRKGLRAGTFGDHGLYRLAMPLAFGTLCLCGRVRL